MPAVVVPTAVAVRHREHPSEATDDETGFASHQWSRNRQAKKQFRLPEITCVGHVGESKFCLVTCLWPGCVTFP